MKLKNISLLFLAACGIFVWAFESGFNTPIREIPNNAELQASASPPPAEEPSHAEVSKNTAFPAPSLTADKPQSEQYAVITETSVDAGPEPAAASDLENSEESAVSPDVKTMPEDEAKTDMAVITGVVEQGDTVGKILSEAVDGRVQHYISAMRKVFSPAAFRPGQPYAVVTDPESGGVKRFEYEINDLRRLVVEGGEHPRARLEDIEYVTVLETCAGVIEDNLFQAVTDAGEKPEMAVRLAELFGSEINFVRDLQEGDSFTVLHEEKYRDGHPRGYGRILAARFTNRGKTFEAFLFRDAQGKPHYYNSKGESLKKTLLQAPLAITRVTSRFSHSRKHPILGKSRPHLGVDYGAPAGTPVKAVGDGVVTKRSWAGGYGNQVIIKHSSDLESLYAHLSRYASGLRLGQKVRQGQVIGYVGSTGLSTGPHLDFRLRQKGSFINPAKAINPRSNPVSRAMMNAFTKTMAQERAYLDGHRLPRHYALDSLVPLNVASNDDENEEKVTKKVSRTKKLKGKSQRRKNSRLVSKKRS